MSAVSCPAAQPPALIGASCAVSGLLTVTM